MKKLTTYAACLLIAVLPGCQLLGMTPEQETAARQSLQNSYEAGQITAAQRDAALEAIDRGQAGTTDWQGLLIGGGSVLASILLGVPIAVGRVNQVRGSIYARKGSPPSPAAPG